MRVLVTGATGYIGGRLVPRLIEAGHDVRVLVRRPERLREVPWAASVDVIAGDLGDRAAVDRAMEGVEVVYYLVHSMGGTDDFEMTELTIARNVAASAREHGVRRIVYLGGLHPRRRHGSRGTCARGRRWGRSCSGRACPPSCCRPVSSSARGRPRSR